MRIETWPRALLVVTLLTFLALGVVACHTPPSDYPTRSKEFEFVGWHGSTGRLAPTPYRAVLVWAGEGDVGWTIVPKGHEWDGDETTKSAAIRFYAAADRDYPDEIGRRFLWATVVPGDREYQVLVGPERGRGEPVSELRVIDWDGRVRTIDLDPAFWRLSMPAKHAPRGK